ncbi:Sec-independent protein translocase subunit TatA/TatB [Legionella nagasakiensis]|uniref:Sec-independent protein translocase subunit TatA/TatB n=1 Tax=Legionella nagasakiensis TaxID=535290 RepID=UPI0010564189|nr:twin-arginine translocase TatA/TatE family subunit [Legionella nagasakiensis]
MSFGELLLIVFVALLVFGPSKLPMLAKHLAKLVRVLNHYQKELSQFWQSQLKEHQLQENLKKAQQADLAYKSHNTDSEKIEPRL